MQKSAIITGANDGIGRGIALGFARRGYRLGLLARREEQLRQVADECRRAGAPQVEISSIDVTHTDPYRQELIRLDEALQGAELFVANAGIDSRGKRTEDNGDAAKRTIEVNVTGVMTGIELMKTRMITRGHGTLSAVGSVAGARGLPTAGVYCASKAAVHAYLESLRIDMRPFGLRVCEVAPGFIDTAMTRSNKDFKPFMIDADRAGEIFVRKLIRGKRMIIAPWPYAWAILAMKYAPAWLYEPAASIFDRKS